ncbi:MAG: hypothetical protein HY558_00530 [Euryarchaeota archaeon]|nr:hypothetical protein [Euryarchaeota archaeon]
MPLKYFVRDRPGEFIIYRDHTDLFGVPVLFEEMAVRVGRREELEARFTWRLMPETLLDTLSRMDPGKRYILVLARKNGSAAITLLEYAKRKDYLETLLRELRERASTMEKLGEEELHDYFVVQVFEYEPGVG